MNYEAQLCKKKFQRNERKSGNKQIEKYSKLEAIHLLYSKSAQFCEVLSDSQVSPDIVQDKNLITIPMARKSMTIDPFTFTLFNKLIPLYSIVFKP